MALVRYTISNAPLECENGLCGEFICSLPVTGATLAQIFPYEGNFALRYRVSGDKVRFPGVESVWMDIQHPGESLPMDDVGGIPRIDIMAMVIDVPEGPGAVENFMIDPMDLYSEEEYGEYLESMTQRSAMMGGGENSERKPVEREQKRSGLGGFSLNKLGKGMENLMKKGSKELSKIKKKDIASVGASIWGGVTSAAAGVTNLLGGGQSVLSDASMDCLSNMSEHLDTKFNDSDPMHGALLRDLWGVCFQDAAGSYSRQSERWKEMGFQKPDPIQDLKMSGTLALRGMLHLATNYKARTQSMLDNNRQNLKSKYPFAIVGINVTLLLADVLKLSNMGFLGIRANYWELFEDEEAFFEIFSYCFMAMDTIWRQRKAVRADFGKITGEIKEKMKVILGRGPKSIRDFKLVAIDEDFVSSA